MNNFRYTNQKCAVCGKIFTESDDIVVCPLCATPHHRECYKQNGECGNSDRHSEGFIWAPEQSPEETQETPDIQTGTSNAQASENVNQQIPPFAAPQYPPFTPYQMPQAPNFNFPNPLSAFPPDLDDGVSTADASVYLGPGNFSYLQKFFLEKSGKRTFNVWAFLFGGLWFIYRKMYKLGAIFIALSLVISAIPLFVPQYINLMNDLDAVTEEYSQMDTTADDALSQVNEMYSKMWQTFKKYPVGIAADLICSAASLALAIYLGFTANKKYKEHVILSIKDTKKIPSENCNETFKEMIIANLGGRSLPWALVAFFVMNAARIGLSVLSGLIIK